MGGTMSKAAFHRWADLPQTEMTPQIKRRLISGEKVMMVLLTFDQGAIVAQHKHPHEQITHIVSGSMEFEIDGEKRVLSSGEAAYVPSNVPHGAVLLADTVTLEVFSPPREDFLSGEKADYMK
jgi:quercetin dioxygenase-like cupin family protein